MQLCFVFRCYPAEKRSYRFSSALAVVTSAPLFVRFT